MESNMEVPIKVKIDLPYNPPFHFCEYAQKEMITIIRPYIHTYAYGSTIHNSQDMETTQMLIEWWMDKKDVVYIHNGILFNHEKKAILLFTTTWMR